MHGRCAIFAFAIAPLAVGCASEKKNSDAEGRAPSLVYSPAARLSPDRSDDTSMTTGGSAAQDDVRPPAGRRCRIHLRREAMGVAGQAPYPVTGNNINADRAALTGTLERVGGDWLVLRGDRSTYWVPRDAVLAVEFVE